MIAPDLLPYKHHPDFDDPEAVSKILSYEFDLSSDTKISPNHPYNKYKTSHLLLKSHAEILLFKKLNLLKKLAHDGEPIDGFQDQVKRIKSIIVEHNLRLIGYLFNTKYRSLGYSFDELLSDGVLALYKCVDNFDVSYNYKFSTYACISVIRSTYKSTSRLKFTNQEIRASYEDKSFEAVDNAEEVSAQLEDLFSSGVCSPREIEFMGLRFGFGGKEPLTYETIAKINNITKERVRQILGAAYIKAEIFLTRGHRNGYFRKQSIRRQEVE